MIVGPGLCAGRQAASPAAKAVEVLLGSVVGSFIGKKSIRLLTGDDKIYRPVHLRAVGAKAGLMPARKKGQHTQTRDGGLPVRPGRKGPIRRLLAGDPGQSVVHAILNLLPLCLGKRGREGLRGNG